jgi:hypothetical protein
MTDHVCPQCGKSAYGFPICPWCNSSYSHTEITRPYKPEELPVKYTRMNQWLQQFYFFEFVLVVVPVTLFIIFTLFLLISYAGTGANPSFAFKLLLLWVGGAMGTYALWSMYFRIYKNKSVQSITELPLLALGFGIVANAIPLIYSFLYSTKSGLLFYVLLGFSPVIVALHWSFALMCAAKEIPNTTFKRDALKRAP